MARKKMVNGKPKSMTAKEETARDAEELEWLGEQTARDIQAVRDARRAEMPPEGDMIDAMAKALDGDRVEFDALQVVRNAIKAKYPKP